MLIALGYFHFSNYAYDEDKHVHYPDMLLEKIIMFPCLHVT